MDRGIGGLEPVQDLVPESLAIVVALLTQLGDVWFLSLVVLALYWTRARSEARTDVALVVGVTLAGLGLLQGFKYYFRLPRPDQPLVELERLPWLLQPLYELTGTAAGYGFPSGHAFMTTVVYVSLAGILGVGTRRRRYGVAAGLVAVVCLSRIALGVHYVVDVVAGVAVGLAFLLATRWLSERSAGDRPTVAFAVAVACGLFFLVTSGLAADAVLLLGVSLGAFAGWQLVVLGGHLAAVERPTAAVRPLLVRGGLATVALAPPLLVLEELPLASVPARGGVAGIAAALVVTVPVARYSERVQRAGAAARFWTRAAWSGARGTLPTVRHLAVTGVRTGVTRLRKRLRNPDP